MYALKVSGALAYVGKVQEVAQLAPVHAARVYEALEGVRAVQWARGWAPPRNRSFRWQLRRISQLATVDTKQEGVEGGGGLADVGCGRNGGACGEKATMGRFEAGAGPPEIGSVQECRKPRLVVALQPPLCVPRQQRQS
jgi:hypothetical protein